MKKIALILYFFLAPTLVYVVQETSWLEEVSGEYYTYTIAIFLMGLSFPRDILKTVIYCFQNEPDWKLVGTFLIFMISAILSIAGGITFFVEATTGNLAPIFIATGSFVLANVVRWLYEQYPKEYLSDNLVIHIIGCQVAFGLMSGFLGWIISFLYFKNAGADHAMQSSLHSDFFTWFIIGGMLIGGLIASCESDETNDIIHKTK